jgi:uncharacterized protein (DUF608 family)
VSKSLIPYSREELRATGPQPTYTGRGLDFIAFPLGGIGTGTVSLGGWGQLRDLEVMNRPNKGFDPPMTFFALRVRDGKTPPVARILQGPRGGSYVGDGNNPSGSTVDGLPHFRQVAFRGEYPFAYVDLLDGDLPIDATLEAFNPCIPLNADDSGIPVAIFRYHLRNRTKRPLEATVFGSLSNVIADKDGRVNTAKRGKTLSGLFCSTDAEPADSPRFGSMALATPAKASVCTRMPVGHLRLNKLWEILSGQIPMPSRPADGDSGLIAVDVAIPPGGEVVVPFYLTWHFPTVEHWNTDDCGCRATWQNYYAAQWSDAWDVARYVAKHVDRLHAETQRFHDALFASTLPAHVLDAVSSQLSILRTTTCLRLPDGTLYGFEGCKNTSGCCQGSCTHVWNYAQAMPYLFPDLQRSMAEAHFDYSMSDDGYIQFRMPLPLGTKAKAGFVPAADGQMGLVMQVYREWLISGDVAWLERIWPKAKAALEFAWKYWDADQDGVIENAAHNTYDQEFWGPNTMIGSLYLGALAAGEAMAAQVGDLDAAETYRELLQHGSAWTDANLWNGEYYEQQVNPTGNDIWPEPYHSIIDRGSDGRIKGWPAWQYGKGCLADQLIGQWIARMLHLGDLYDREHVRRALRAVFEHNWRTEFHRHPCTLRAFAFNDDAGLLICTWPRGERPGKPFWFADEVWSGIEYQVASHLIYEGQLDEGLAICRGVRDRYRGDHRNPWDEIECGHHYSRSMASYAVMLALAGFRYSAPERTIGLAPRLNEDDFACFFSVGSGWGLVSQKVARKSAKLTVRVDSGDLAIERVETPLAERLCKATVSVGGRRISARVVDSAIVLGEPTTIPAGSELRVSLK